MTDAREKVRSDAAIHVAIIDAVERFRPVTPIDASRVPDLQAELERIACLVAGASGFRILGSDEIDQLCEDIQVAVSSMTGDCKAHHKIALNHMDRAMRALKEKRT